MHIYLYIAFWLKENTYRVQPQVAFKHELILLVEGVIEGTNPLESFSYVYGTYPGYNNYYKSFVRVPIIKVYLIYPHSFIYKYSIFTLYQF